VHQRDIQRKAEESFAAVAAFYATSAVHADADALEELVRVAQPKLSDVVLDLATGAGHTAFAFAPHVQRVVAYDLTPAMLEQTGLGANQRGLKNIETVLGSAEQLPFEDDTFDLYTVRIAPHHFADLSLSIREAHRVLKPGGKYLVVDTSVPEDGALDAEINEIEKIRDPSHVRNYRLSEWQQMLTAAGFHIESAEYGYISELDSDDWLARMRTPEPDAEALRQRFRDPRPELREALKIRVHEQGIGFTLPRVTILASK